MHAAAAPAPLELILTYASNIIYISDFRTARITLIAVCLVSCEAWQPALSTSFLPSMQRSHHPLFFFTSTTTSRFTEARIARLQTARRERSPAYTPGCRVASRAAYMLITAGDKMAHSFDVFIEDTDCFGVVYNANYLKFFDRARQEALGLSCLASREAGHHLRLVENKEIKLSGSAVLGQRLEVESSFKAVSADTPLLLRWLQTLRCKASGALIATSDAVTFLGSSETLRELTARLAGEGKPCDMSFDSFLPPPVASTKAQPPPLNTNLPAAATPPLYQCHHTVYADEMDARGSISEVSLLKVSILKLMERNRNTALGGAVELARLQAEGCLIVVTHINDLKVDLSQRAELGSRVKVRSTATCRKFKFTFLQVTCFSIDAGTKKPKSPPLWVLMRLGLLPEVV